MAGAASQAGGLVVPLGGISQFGDNERVRQAEPGLVKYVPWMEMALAHVQAEARAEADVPVAALVMTEDGSVVGRGSNQREDRNDPTAHAEIVALRLAGAQLGRWRLDGCTLIVTLEPCAMCAGAAVAARVDRIVFGAFDTKAGACGSVWDLPRDRASLHQPEVIGGVLADQAAAVLTEFFRSRRQPAG